MEKINGEIEVDLMEEIIKTLPKLTAIHSTGHVLLIHGMGGQPRSFYRNLRNNKDVEILWTGWSSKVWWTYLLSFIPGQAGLTKIINRQKLDSIFLDIGELSMCGLYFIPNDKLRSVVDKIKKERTSDIIEYLVNEKDYFLLTVDFDYHGGDRDGEIFYTELILGDNLDNEIKEIVTKTR